jgi:hypothetical protein
LTFMLLILVGVFSPSEKPLFAVLLAMRWNQVTLGQSLSLDLLFKNSMNPFT